MTRPLVAIALGVAGCPATNDSSLGSCGEMEPSQAVVIDATRPELVGAPITLFQNEMTIEYTGADGRDYVVRYRYCKTWRECDRLH